MIRPAVLSDAPMLARIHVQAWAETYPGLLPAAEIARLTYEIRLDQWVNQINAGLTRVLLIPDLGFVQFGLQRSNEWAELGYTEELFALYLLQSAKGQGLGRALLAAGRTQAAFTALVFDGNTRACRFYERTGAHLLKKYNDFIGETPVGERVYGWDAT